MDIRADITLLLAVLGSALGIMNTWQNFRRDRSRVRVVAEPKPAGSGGQMWLVTVVNLSAFPVTIAEFCVESGRKAHVSPALALAREKCIGARAAETLRVFAKKDGDFPARGRFRVRTHCGAVATSKAIRFDVRKKL
mgnify:CR=1 FL=1